jgi:murein DD-endopeptidase MepM/ murein hydrolase activator NlpD
VKFAAKGAIIDPMDARRTAIGLVALLLAGGCATPRLDRSPTPRLVRRAAAQPPADWPGWAAEPDPAAAPGAAGAARPERPVIAVAQAEVQRAIDRFQQRRRGSGPMLDAAWPPFLEMMDLYLAQAPERLSLAPLIRARIAAEFELDRERRRPVGTPPELERAVLRLLIRIDRRVRAMRTLATAASRTSRARDQGLQWPVGRGVITSGFGNRRDPIHPEQIRFHAGLDLSARPNAPIYAAAAGRVVQAAWVGSAGRCVRLRHPGGTETLYGHLSMIMVKVGQRVGAGDVIGLLGASGRATGPHLHFAVYRGGEAVDPLDHLRQVPLRFSDHQEGIVFGWGQ